MHSLTLYQRPEMWVAKSGLANHGAFGFAEIVYEDIGWAKTMKRMFGFAFVMSWFAWLALAVLITAVAAVSGIKPKGTRHVAHTRLMGMARLVLLVLVIIFAYLAFRARSGG